MVVICLRLRKNIRLFLVLLVLFPAIVFGMCSAARAERRVRPENSSSPRFFYSCETSGSESGMINYGIEGTQVKRAIAERIQSGGGIVVESRQEADYEVVFNFEAEFGLVRWRAKIQDVRGGNVLVASEGQKEVSGMSSDAVQAMTDLAIGFAKETLAGFFEKNQALASNAFKPAPTERPTPPPTPVVTPPPTPVVEVVTPKLTPVPIERVSTPPPPPVAPKPTPSPVAATPPPPPPPPQVVPKPVPHKTTKQVIPAPLPPPPSPSESDGEPPEITMTYPEEPESHTTEKTITLAGVIRDPEGIDSYTISANGVQIFPPKNKRNVVLKAKGIPISTQVDLKMGENVITISATDKQGNPAQNFIKVHREPPFHIAATTNHPEEDSQPSPPSKFALWAVVIGINNFQDQDIPPLRYAVPDAQGFKNFLEGQKATGLYKSVNIKYLTDREATLQNIKAALGEFLVDARGDDIVYIFIAGHGMVDSQGDSYILTYDAKAKNLYSTALPMEEFKKLLKDRIYAERTIVIADACHSGGIGTNMRGGARDLSMDEFRKFLETSKGRAILTASRSRELSQEDPKLGHGLFTYYMLEGLKGKADANGDGVITLNELNDYLYIQVVKASGSTQHPELKGEFDNSIPIGIIKK